MKTNIKGYKEIDEEGTEAIAIIDGKKYEWFGRKLVY